MTDLSGSSEHCITCGDEGTPMTVLGVDRPRSLARCRDDETGTRSIVEIALIESVRPGDRILVHAGTAIARLGSSGDVA